MRENYELKTLAPDRLPLRHTPLETRAHAFHRFVRLELRVATTCFTLMF